MPAQLHVIANTVTEIPFQDASMDIWDTKYRLKSKDGIALDGSIDETYQRVAKALSEVEKGSHKQEQYYKEFLWALRQGVIPAGRIISNAGALAHKPATSTINCTVSGTIADSMDDILGKVHEAGLTLKAGCVAPNTLVCTEKGYVTAVQAVTEKHQQILSYDRDSRLFEMRPILKHMTTVVPTDENIEIGSHLGTLTTSIKHPVLVYRDDKLQYVRADEINQSDALVHYQLPWEADKKSALKAWFAGAHLGDGSSYEKHMTYAPSREKWQIKAKAHGKRLIFKIRAAEREVVERYAHFFQRFYDCQANVVQAVTPNNTTVWDFTVASFKASAASELFDNQCGKKSHNLKVPQWIKQAPDRVFLPFLAGLIDTDGTISTERGSAILSCQCAAFADEIQSLLALFGVHAAITQKKERSHEYNGNIIKDSGGYDIKISDSGFLIKMCAFMADSGKINRIKDHKSQAGQYDHYVMTSALRAALETSQSELSHTEKQTQGIYHGKHKQATVSRVYLDKWAEKFPLLNSHIDFVRQLRPVKSIKRNLDIGETFYDFTVDKHNNYLAGNGGLAVIHNCGIGYEFSTLRPKDAYVSGAGAYTSGPLSFMDIYDKMCFTVSSAGGRRGAQMATFDVGHPDVVEFIRAKRENGRLRQFNLSLLITTEFMQAVKNDLSWPLSFPVTEKEVKLDKLNLKDSNLIIWRELPAKDGYVVNSDGLIACKITKTIPARRLWDIIMSSTYDYAEPGFILIDKVNEMNNNWFCEKIRATNPCVTGDTWVQTEQGPRQVNALLGQQINVMVDGQLHQSGAEGFFKTATQNVVKLITKEGFNLRLTEDHQVRKITRLDRYNLETEWCAAGQLHAGDQVLLNNHRQQAHWTGQYTENQGYLIGLLIGDGTLKEDKAVLSVWKSAQVMNSDINTLNAGVDAIMDKVMTATVEFTTRSDFKGWSEIAGRNEHRLSFSGLKTLAEELGMSPGNKCISAQLETASSEFYRGFLQVFFDADGSVQGTQSKGVSVRLAQSDLPRLEAVQRMLLRLGINSTLYRNRRPAGITKLPNGKGGVADYKISAQHELVISGDNLAVYQEAINFTDCNKAAQLEFALKNYRRSLNKDRFTATIESITPDGCEDVFDIQVPGINTFDANGLHAHNCGEQPLPPYGSCLLGSINLTRFVKKPFTQDAYFDWDTYRKAIRIFTRMLDNVVEINGLPLPQQREEIISKRRHGMGYLGLGSTVTMLGMKYGDAPSLHFTEEVTKTLAVEGWKAGLSLAKEKGPAPIMEQLFAVTGEMLHKRPEMIADGYKVGDEIAGKLLHAKYSRYMQQLAKEEPELIIGLTETGARFTHHSSIAPTGTISLSLANNASNGIEPSFAHHYSRNVIRAGKKSKEKIDVFSFELLAYREMINADAMPYSDDPAQKLPDYFIAADDVTPKQHVDIQAAAQKWIDSSISKTANVPTDFPYEEFKSIYEYAYDKGLKGCTTFRFNPEVFQGVLVKESDLENTTYQFTLEDGEVIELKGNEEVEYDGEMHSAANLFDALKEGYYGKF